MVFGCFQRCVGCKSLDEFPGKHDHPIESDFMDANKLCSFYSGPKAFIFQGFESDFCVHLKGFLWTSLRLSSRINTMYNNQKTRNINEKWTMNEDVSPCISYKKWRIFQPALAFWGVNTLHPIPASWNPNPQLTLVAASPESRKSAVPGATWETSKRPICAWRSLREDLRRM